MLGDTHDAEDIAQQALLKGLTGIRQLRDNEHFGAWISRIAKNLCIDFIRKHKHRHAAFDSPRRSVERTDYPEPLRGSPLRDKLQVALASLAEDASVVLMLFYFDGRSTKNIAETLDISQAAVQTRLSRARRQLRKLLEAEGDT
jgi:RNA polymerase sigma-70 factor (ECF subfamily)